MANQALSKAKSAKNDEFYTQYDYIQKEINAYLEFNPKIFQNKVVLLPCDDPEYSNFTKFFAQNFENFGLKKLISTSFSRLTKGKLYPAGYQFSLFDVEKNGYDEEKAIANGKIFTLTRDSNKSGTIDIDDLEWRYLDGDGDFRSDEVKGLRDEADFIITNPPFSLFREFIAWIAEADKKFLVIGNQNAITYKEIFPLIKNNRLWLGATCNSEDMVFGVPKGAEVAPKDREKAAKLGYVGDYTRLGNSCWFSNIDHGRRHQPLSLMSMADNLKYSKHQELKDSGYQKYDNYDAIEIPYTDSIPIDYNGVMGVPISFLPKYCPEQFEILGITLGNTVDYEMTTIYENAIQHNKNGTTQGGSKVNTRAAILVKDIPSDTVYYTADNADGYLISIYPRILIRKRAQ